MFIGVPLLAIGVLNVYTWQSRKAAMYAAMFISAAQIALASYCILSCFNTGEALNSTFLGTFSVDLFSAIVLLIIGLIGLVTLLVASDTVQHSRFGFGDAVLLLMMGMNGVVMVTDVFSLYVFIEITSTSSFLLIAINKRRDELEGAFKYYLMSALATTMMLTAITTLFALVGDTSFESVAQYIRANSGQSRLLPAVFILYTAALAIKSGVVPFHTWVPDAHSSAPSPVSIMLAGIVIKVSGVYALMRIYRDVFLCDPATGSVLMVLSLASIIVGALAAMGQTDIKRMLAFSSVSQIGYIILGVASGSALGFVGAVMHYFNHASFKSLLFVDAAALLKQTGTRNMDEMGGLGKKMPLTSISSILGLLSMAGIPPLSGFWSKLLIVAAVWRISPAIAVGALVSSVLTLTYFLIIQKKVFYGKPSPEMENVQECGGNIRVVQLILSGINVLAGLVFPFLLPLLGSAGIL